MKYLTTFLGDLVSDGGRKFISGMGITFILFVFSPWIDNFWIKVIFSVVGFIIYVLYVLLFLNSNKDGSSLLSIKKSEFYAEIVSKINELFDNELAAKFQKGELSEANKIIGQKIIAINELSELFNEDSSKLQEGIKSASKFYEATKRRIENELSRLTTNGNICLIIGIVLSVASIFSLVYFVYINPDVKILAIKEPSLLLILPKVVLSILIQTISFYFLSLFRKIQTEIKYWQNERTALDLKIFILSIGDFNKEIGTVEFMQKMMSDLLKIERNIPDSKLSNEESDKKEGEDFISKTKDVIMDTIKK